MANIKIAHDWVKDLHTRVFVCTNCGILVSEVRFRNEKDIFDKMICVGPREPEEKV